MVFLISLHEKNQMNCKRYSNIKNISITNICRDPKDNMFLNCALAGKADFIISGDDDLLALKKVSEIEIIKPVHFLKKIRKSR